MITLGNRLATGLFFSLLFTSRPVPHHIISAVGLSDEWKFFFLSSSSFGHLVQGGVG